TGKVALDCRTASSVARSPRSRSETADCHHIQVQQHDPPTKEGARMRLRVLASLAAFGLLAMTPLPVLPGVFPPNSRFFGQTYGEWTADWWTWFMEHPLTGHPGLDDGLFDVTSGQSGRVWFLGAPLDFGAAVPRTRNITVTSGTALLVGLINA